MVTIGLPARGKTHISRALERYLRWMGVKTQVVSLGDFRRKTMGGAQMLPPDYFSLGESLLWGSQSAVGLSVRSRAKERGDDQAAPDGVGWLREAHMGVL